MARSWRSFLRRNTDEEQENGPAVASGPEPDVEAGNGHRSADLAEGVPKAEEVQAERKEPAPPDAWEVDETEPDEAEETLPEPSAAEEAQEDAGTVAELQESGGWFGRLRQGLSRSRASFVGQLNAAVAEFRDVEDEEFWERVEEILISSDVGVPTTAKLVGELEQEALERNITSGKELRELMIEHATSMLEGPVELDVSHDAHGDPDGRGKRDGQDDDDRQALAFFAGDEDVRRRGHVQGCGHRAASAVGREDGYARGGARAWSRRGCRRPRSRTCCQARGY